MTARAFPWRGLHIQAMAVVVLLLGCVSAAAHAALTKAEPSDGSILAAAPKQLALSFSEPVSPLVLTLIHPDGSSEKLETYKLRDRVLEIDAPKDMSDGTYVFTWRIVSEDGHPVGGSVIFSIGAPSSAPPAVGEPIDWPVRAGVWLSKFALYLGLFLGIGSVFANAWVTRQPVSGVAVSLVGLGMVATPLSIGFQGLDALGVSLSALSDFSVWKTGFNTTFGRSGVIAMLAFTGALLAAVSSKATARILSGLALLGIGAALASSGHASAAEPRWLTAPMVFLHGVGIAFWAGALIPLGVVLKHHSPTSIDALQRFSKTIPPVVGILALAGIVLAIIQVETPTALLATAYGNVLLVKLALLGLLFTLAVINRWTLSGPTERGDPSAARRLIRSIAAETAIVILIFAVAAAWRFTPPPRALAIAAAQPSSVHLHSDKAMAQLKVTPGSTGVVDISIGSLSKAKEVSLVLSNPSSGIEPIRRPAQKSPDGKWRINDMVIPVAGKWTVRLDVLISDFEMTRLQGELEIRP